MGLPKLEPHLHDLPPEVFGSKTGFLAQLGQSAAPIATMVTCWELASIPQQVSHAEPGEIMVIQNLGGLVAAVGAEASTSDSTLYYLQHPTINHLIVCGHSQCRTLAALLCNNIESTSDAFRLIREYVSRRFEECYMDRPRHEWLGIIAQESVIQQLVNLCGHAIIRTRLRNGSLHLHGWMRDDETSAVSAFDPTLGQFSA
jgi:carbonic anhydrase